MKLGILQCDEVAPELKGQFGAYPDMFVRSLGAIDESLTFETFPVYKNEFPKSPESCDAWLITGSKFSVYESKPWIAPLEDFVRQLYQRQIKTLGICFGHQLIAQALGGVVKKADQGWGLGLTRQKIIETPHWLVEKSDHFDLLVVFQDQVISVPESGKVIFTSHFCPNFGIQYGNSLLSIQGHPEFTRDYLSALMDFRKGSVLAEDDVEKALSSLSDKHHGERVNQWLVGFLKS